MNYDDNISQNELVKETPLQLCWGQSWWISSPGCLSATNLSWYWCVLDVPASFFMISTDLHLLRYINILIWYLSLWKQHNKPVCALTPITPQLKWIYCMPLHFFSNKYWKMAYKLFFFFLWPCSLASTWHFLRGTWKEDWKNNRGGRKEHREKRHVIICQHMITCSIVKSKI